MIGEDGDAQDEGGGKGDEKGPDLGKKDGDKLTKVWTWTQIRHSACTIRGVPKVGFGWFSGARKKYIDRPCKNSLKSSKSPSFYVLKVVHADIMNTLSIHQRPRGPVSSNLTLAVQTKKTGRERERERGKGTPPTTTSDCVCVCVLVI